MKKRLLLSLLVFVIAFMAYSSDAYAAPKTMPDGQIFDAEFYAAMYPDVVAVLGTDEAKLYQHYVTYGKKEGRLPYAPVAAATAATPAPAPKTNDKIILDEDGGIAKQNEMQLTYIALPQNVKDYFNRKNITIYACSKDFLKARLSANGKGTLGRSYSTLDENGNLVSATVYVSGSENSFMPAGYTLCHELGHILNCNQRYSKNWEGWVEMIPYSKTQVYNANEAFSEAFAGYLLRPDKLKKTAPNAYAYIEGIIVAMN